MRWEKERFKVIKRVEETLHRWSMFPPGAKVLVAVSGGGDSLVLLDVLVQLADELKVGLQIVHVDHGLRPESGKEAAMVEEVAGYYGLPCRVFRVEVSKKSGVSRLSPEEAAREVRYRAFHEALKESGAERLATGHTADDVVETLLLRLISGAGPAGMGSIPPVRPPYVRPLIRVWREEVRRYQRFLPFAPVQDPSNLDLSIPRNRIRHKLLPLLEGEYNPSVRRALLKEADTLAALGELLESLTRQAEQEDVTADGRGLEVNLASLRARPLAVQRHLLASCLRRIEVEPRFELVEDIRLKLLEADGNPCLDLGSGLVAQRSYRRLFMGPRAAPVPMEETLIPDEGAYFLPGPGLRLEIMLRPREAGEPRRDRADPHQALLDADRLSFPLQARGVRPGDRFHPLGSPGRRKLQDFLVDLKVPRSERGRVAVLVSAGEIAWVVGLRIDERFKVTEETTRVAALKVEVARG